MSRNTDFSTWQQKLLSRSVLIPTILFISFIALNLSLLTSGQRKYENLLRILSQWDGQHYLSIARDGYEIFPCPNMPSNFICGNAGWFPLYPILGKIFSLGVLDERWVLLALSWLALWGALLLFYKLLSEMFNDTIAGLSCLLLLLFPTSFYFVCVFPYSLYLLLALVVIFLLHRKKYHWLWLPCGMLAITYPSGALIGLPVLYERLHHHRELSPQKRTYLVVALLVLPIAIALYFGYYWLKFDDFLLYTRYQGQSYYGHKLTIPFITLYYAFKNLPLNNPEVIAVLFAFGTLALMYTRKLPMGWLLYVLAIFLFTPTFGTTQCYYRHIVIAFPLSVMVALASQSKRKWLVPLYAAVAIGLYLFIYLPQFKLGTLM